MKLLLEWELHPLDVQRGVFGLVYPGLCRNLSWAYLTLGPGAAVLSQPRDDSNNGTSLTNIWSQEFITQLRQLAELDDTTRFFEHYYHDTEPTFDLVTLSAAGTARWGRNLKWQHIAHTQESVADAFFDIVGEPIPDFAALPWGPAMSSDAAHEQWQHAQRKRDEENIAYAARCPECGKMVVVPAQATPAEMYRWIHGDEPCRPTL